MGRGEVGRGEMGIHPVALWWPIVWSIVARGAIPIVAIVLWWPVVWPIVTVGPLVGWRVPVVVISVSGVVLFSGIVVRVSSRS